MPMWHEHVVGQRAQQPHRIDGVRQLAAERDEVAVRLGHQREVVVLVLEAAAARADEDAGAVAVASPRAGASSASRCATIARRVDRAAAPRTCPTRSVRRMSLCSLRSSTSARAIEVGDLGRDVRRPVASCPTAAIGRDRRSAGETAARIASGASPAAADRAAAGDDDARRHGDAHAPRRCAPSHFRRDGATRCSCSSRRSRTSSTASCARAAAAARSTHEIRGRSPASRSR